MSKPAAPFPMKLRLPDDSGMSEFLTAEEMYEKRDEIISHFEAMRNDRPEFSINPWVVAMNRFAVDWEADEISK
jgi:hypothetical protein